MITSEVIPVIIELLPSCYSLTIVFCKIVTWSIKGEPACPESITVGIIKISVHFKKPGLLFTFIVKVIELIIDLRKSCSRLTVFLEIITVFSIWKPACGHAVINIYMIQRTVYDLISCKALSILIKVKPLIIYLPPRSLHYTFIIKIVPVIIKIEPACLKLSIHKVIPGGSDLLPSCIAWSIIIKTVFHAVNGLNSRICLTIIIKIVFL